MSRHHRPPYHAPHRMIAADVRRSQPYAPSAATLARIERRRARKARRLAWEARHPLFGQIVMWLWAIGLLLGAISYGINHP